MIHPAIVILIALAIGFGTVLSLLVWVLLLANRMAKCLDERMEG